MLVCRVGVKITFFMPGDVEKKSVDAVVVVVVTGSGHDCKLRSLSLFAGWRRQ